MLEFHALGGLGITVDGREVALGGPRQRRLLAMFLIHRNTVVSLDRLADAVFAGEPTASANTTLRSYVSRIRRVVTEAEVAPTVIIQAPGYLLVVADEAFDVACFERGVAEADAHAGRGDHAAVAVTLRAALDRWQGEAYDEFADEDWARPEAQRLGELRLVAFERLFEAELEVGRAAGLIPEIETLVDAHPTREGLRAQLIVALYRAGRQADALRAFQELRRDLRDELGVDPTPALVDLERRVLAHDPTLLLADPTGQALRGYVIGERLGTGRDGTVFAARLPGVERELAIRVVHESVADCPEFVRTFESTACRIASLDHPAIVPIQDYWREPGAAYLVMRRLHGGSLTDRLARGALSVEETARLVDRIGGALLLASEAGLAHGRVSPDSVLFDDAGEPCLGDFALATTADDVRDRDVHDLAVLVRTCLAGRVEVAEAALARGVAPNDRPSMADFVPLLGDVLADGHRRVGPPPNPYKSLRAFDEVDAVDFFGRSDVVAEILRRLGQDGRQGRLVLVVGGSGTGKSSIVRAGVLPELRVGGMPGSAGWFVTTMLPGATPFAALAESLRQVAVVDSAGLADELAADPGAIDRVIRRVVPEGGQMLLLVDQFEELFTSATDRDQKAFLAGLLHAISADDSRLRVVATLRADFYDRPLGVSGFGAVVNDATVTIPAMSAAELEAAVVGPAERVGRRVETALVAELVSAVADEPAALPALQFTLYELAQRGGTELTLAAYRELGELERAVAARAEGLYRTLDDDERADVRRLFEQLVVVAPGEEPTRRRAPRTELSAGLGDDRVGPIIDRWTVARLLSVDRHPQTRVPTVELAHEALLREWPRLQGWIEEGREDLGVLSRLRDAAASWLQVGRDAGALYRGAQLAMVEDVIGRSGRELPPLDDEFLDASRGARDAEAQEVADRVARQARANRRLRIQLVAIAVALVVALAGGLVAVNQRGAARRERQVATARELAAASTASVADDAERAVLLALAAVDATRTHGEPVIPEAVEALHEAVAASRVVRTFPDLGGSVDWSPDGRLFATEGPEESGLIDVRDARTGAPVLSVPGHEIDVNAVAFSPDGSMLATTGDDAALRIWDPETGEQVASFRFGREAEVWGLSFSPDGRRVAATWLIASTVRVFDLASERMVAELPGLGAFSTSFSADGRRLAVGSDFGGPARVFDISTGELAFTVGDVRSWVRTLAFSPDGRWLATSGDQRTRLWRADTGEAAVSITGHTGYVNALAWSSDGTRLATVSSDGTAFVSDIVDGGVEATLALSADDTGGGLHDVDFSPDGERLLTSDIGLHAVKVWDVSADGGAEWTNLSDVSPFADAAVTPDGGIVVADPEGGVAVWDAETGIRRQRIGVGSPGAHGVTDFAMTEDGDLLALVWDQRRVDIWDTREGERLVVLPSEITGGYVDDVAWTHDGHRLAVGAGEGDERWVSVVDAGGTELARLPEDEVVDHIGQLTFNADDRLLANTRVTHRNVDTGMGVHIWDWEAEEAVRFIPTASLVVEFAPRDDRLVTIRRLEGHAEVWDADSGERLASLAAPSLFSDVTYSPDGAQIATAGGDGLVRLWDAETGEQELELRGHLSTVRVLTFSPDGSRLVSVSDPDNVGRVWALDLDDLVELASGHVTRSFTQAECRRYLHVDTCPEA